MRTRPEEAAVFALDAGVDALAVAVGKLLRHTERTAELDLALIADIRAEVGVPWCCTGPRACRTPSGGGRAAGMPKVDIATHLNSVFTAAVRALPLRQDPGWSTPQVLGPCPGGRSGRAATCSSFIALR